MIQKLRGKLTYANVMATGAMFVALGGGAYALGRSPDHAGVIHGCVNPTSGALRVVQSSCRRATGRGKHRRPAELALNWNQKGTQGPPGASGPPGNPGASVFASRFHNGAALLQTLFGPVSGTGPESNADEDAVTETSPPVPIVARDLSARYIESGTMDGAVREFTLRVNGADVGLSCTYKTPATICSDTSDAVTIPSGSLLAIRFFQGGTDITTGDVIVSFRGTTP